MTRSREDNAMGRLIRRRSEGGRRLPAGSRHPHLMPAIVLLDTGAVAGVDKASSGVGQRASGAGGFDCVVYPFGRV